MSHLGSLCLRPLALAMLVLSVGCGSVSSYVNPSATLPDLTGNWEMVALPMAGTAGLPGPVGGYIGYLSGGTDGKVTGMLNLSITNPVSCRQQLSQPPQISVSGTIDKNNVLTLISPSFAGGSVASLTFKLASDPHVENPGTIQVTGGACATPSAAAAALFFAPVTGTYAGTLTSSSGTTVRVTAHLTQAAPSPANTLGIPVSGDASVAGTTCTNTFSTLSADAFGGLLLASQVGTTANPATLNFFAEIDPHAATLTMNSGLSASFPFTIVAGNCNAGSYAGVLTKQ